MSVEIISTTISIEEKVRLWEKNENIRAKGQISYHKQILQNRLYVRKY